MTFEGFAQAFSLGGGWMYGIVVLGLVFFGMLVRQFIKMKEVDYTWLLLGVFLSVLFLGPMGTAVGVIKAYTSLEFVAPDNRMFELFKNMGPAMHMTAFAFILAVIGTVPLGFITNKVKLVRQSQRYPESHTKKSWGLIWLLAPIFILIIPFAIVLSIFDEGGVVTHTLDAFTLGGPFMLLILLPFLTFCGFFVFQLIKRRTCDVTWILWTLFVMLTLLSILGGTTGFIRASADVAITSHTNIVNAISPGIAVLLNTFSLAVLCCFGAAIPLGILTHFVKRHQLKEGLEPSGRFQ